jgi:hypothetical protein
VLLEFGNDLNEYLDPGTSKVELSSAVVGKNDASYFAVVCL